MVQIIIPTAGRGKRLEKLNPNGIPKSLIKIKDQSLLDWQLKALNSIKDKEFIFIVGAHKELVKKEIKNKIEGTVKFIDNEDFLTTNCGYSLSKALKYINQDWIYLNSDLFFEVAMIEVIKKNLGNNCVCVNFGKKTDLHQFTLGKENLIDKWIPIDTNVTSEKDLESFPKADGEIVGPILGTKNLAHILKRKFEDLNEVRKRNISCYTLFSLVNNANFSILDISKYLWQEVDTIKDFRKAEELINQLVSKKDYK